MKIQNHCEDVQEGQKKLWSQSDVTDDYQPEILGGD